MQKLVFSRCSGKLGTATRHQGPKTGTVWSVRENPSKSPKRPALPDAVNREGAVSRHRPFVLLFFFTSPEAIIRLFSTLPTRGRIWFLGVWDGSFPHPGGKPATQALTGRNRRSLGSGCWVQKSRCPVLSDSGLKWSRLILPEIFRFFLILRPEEVFLPQIIRLLLGDVPSPLVGVDRAIQFICQAI